MCTGAPVARPSILARPCRANHDAVVSHLDDRVAFFDLSAIGIDFRDVLSLSRLSCPIHHLVTLSNWPNQAASLGGFGQVMPSHVSTARFQESSWPRSINRSAAR